MCVCVCVSWFLICGLNQKTGPKTRKSQIKSQKNCREKTQKEIVASVDDNEGRGVDIYTHIHLYLEVGGCNNNVNGGSKKIMSVCGFDLPCIIIFVVPLLFCCSVLNEKVFGVCVCVFLYWMKRFLVVCVYVESSQVHEDSSFVLWKF